MSESRVTAGFVAARRERRAALIPYLTAGFPSAAATGEALAMVADAGADVIELGVPFSDPLADGPIIQRASEVALRGGMSLAGVLRMLEETPVRRPVVLFSYLNPLLAYGIEAFARDARRAGAAGVLITDLPSGEDPAVGAVLRGADLDLITLVAPTTGADRARRLVADASGFVYLIARLGVTGARTDVTGAETVVRRMRQLTTLPLAVGFGIRSVDQVRAVARIADGVVIGSALVERLADGVEPAQRFLEEMRGGLGPF
ncbi:MAG TPA: tryptophan synthase subunit alpha [Gemmatimonadales bacterium]|nr:tryptophan synthase subunit alpha [Gemmatimonadales bacterium]